MLLIGFLISIVVAYGAYQRGSLSRGGALWAVAVGTILFGLGDGMAGTALLGFFLSSTALGRVRKGTRAEDDPQAPGAGIVDKGGRRDAVQVLANGGPAAAFCLLYAVTGELALYVGALGALAAANADTWATEIGMMAGKTPRHVLTLREVPAGTSGGVTVPGTLGLIAGALFIALITFLQPAPGVGPRSLMVLLGGVLGAMADTVLGATVQEVRSCQACGAETEQPRHSCGGTTRVVRGITGIDNDTVNAIATALGGMTAALLWSALR
jgi:uncharacterized protein (TIGR00297 family)